MFQMRFLNQMYSVFVMALLGVTYFVIYPQAQKEFKQRTYHIERQLNKINRGIL